MGIINIDAYREVDPQMLWRGAALNQIDEFEKAIAGLAKRLRVTATVVGSHTSKSINLPVVALTTDAGEFTLRDNFYDINLMAVLRSPSTLTLEQFFAGIQEPLSWEWYLSEIDRARGYTWREWTDEEMNDPRILRVRDKRDGCTMWWEKKGDEKDRWAVRMSSPAWYSHDWSRCEITWDGDFGPGVKLYRQDHAFAQGIEMKTTNRRYVKGVSDFIIATGSLASTITMIEHLTLNVHAGV